MKRSAAFLAALLVLAHPPSRLTAADGQPARRTFAAVLLYRGTVAGNNAGSYGVYVRSADSAWTKVTLSNIISFGLGYFERGATRRYYLAAGNGIHRSVDGGKTWRVLTSWQTEEILSVVPDPVDSAVIYASTPFGVFKTRDDGSTWTKKNTGFRKWFVQRIIMDRRDRRTLYAACEDDLYRSTDAAEHWNPLHVGGAEILAVLQHPADPKVLVVGLEDQGIRFSVDGGRHWKAARMSDTTSIYTLQASADGTTLYAGGWNSGLWRSEDRGATWSRAWARQDVEAVYSVAVDPYDALHLLVGTVGHGVFESHDRGTTWEAAGLNGAQVKQIEFYP